MEKASKRQSRQHNPGACGREESDREDRSPATMYNGAGPQYYVGLWPIVHSRPRPIIHVPFFMARYTGILPSRLPFG